MHSTGFLALELISTCSPWAGSLTSSYSYSSENMSLILLHKALIMIVTDPGKKQTLHSNG